MLQKFKTLEKADKIDFFLKCQRLLIANHPNSPFLFTKDNIDERLTYASDIFNKYQGMCYADENVCVLFNYIRVEDPNDPVAALKANAFKDGEINYNAVSIDWACFRKMKDCLTFCKTVYNTHIEYIVYVHNGKPKTFKTLDFITNVLNIPKV
jgi:hypothetical protein